MNGSKLLPETVIDEVRRGIGTETIIPLVGAAPSLPPSPLMLAQDIPAEIVKTHHETTIVAPIVMHVFRGYEIGGTGLLWNGSDVKAPTTCWPLYIESMANKQADGSHWIGGMRRPDLPVIKSDTPVYMPWHPNWVYGHFLLEMFSRFLLCLRLQDEGLDYPVAMSTRCPNWAKQIVEVECKGRKILWYDSNEQRVAADTILVPSVTETGGHLHPLVNTLIDHYLKQTITGINPPEKYYLSRRQLDPRWRWHIIENEEAVEDEFRRFGFMIVHPEKLSFRQQCSLFINSICVAGEYSSAMHNSLLAPQHSSVFCINWINHFQSRICNLRSQTLSYMEPVGGFRDWRMQSAGFQSLVVDISRLRRSLEMFLQDQQFS